eukprot:1266119-Alexandrium_andersonii.AAC.1
MPMISDAADPRLPAPPTAEPSSSMAKTGASGAPSPPPTAEAAPGCSIATSLASSAGATPPPPSAEAEAFAEGKFE